ncbi:hypothetical protein JXQ70_20255 [bacterium]|nr:hypothetical protein [bacterium]
MLELVKGVKAFLFVLLVIVTFAFMGMGCDFLDELEEDDDDDDSSGELIMPLNIGNIWKYDFMGYEVIYEVIGTTTVSGESVFRIRVKGAGINEVLLMNNKSDGLYDYGLESSPHSGKMYLKYPASEGDTWNYDSTTITVESTGQSATVPAGTFTCFVYRYYDNSTATYNRYYYDPGVGYIQFKQGSNVNLKLKSYGLK